MKKWPLGEGINHTVGFLQLAAVYRASSDVVSWPRQNKKQPTEVETPSSDKITAIVTLGRLSHDTNVIYQTMCRGSSVYQYREFINNLLNNDLDCRWVTLTVKICHTVSTSYVLLSASIVCIYFLFCMLYTCTHAVD